MDDDRSAHGAPDDDTLLAPPADTSEAAASPQPRCAGDYVLGAQIAEGGFGVIFEAEHAVRGDRAAIKIPHAQLAAIPQVVARFEREIEAIQRLGHPNVVRILDTGRLSDGRPWFAMELLQGVPLSEHLARRGRLPVDEALAILGPVCAALEAAHAQSLVHRDIKPSNVFLVNEGGESRVVLVDFGIAKLLDNPSGPDLTASREIIGTIGYLSPEQLLGRPVDHRTDIYGLGALLYVMLVGRPPIMATAQPVMLHLLLHGVPPRPSLHAPVSPAVDEVILRAMHRDPAARHPSAAAFLAHARAAAGLERSAPTPAPPSHGRRGLGIYLEVLTDPGALDAPDPALLDDIESILPTASACLRPDCLVMAVETGTSALFVLEAPEPPILADAARLRVIAAALSLHEALRSRPSSDPRVRIHVSAHIGAIPTGGDEKTALTGALLDLPAWAPEDPEEGVYASCAMLEGLAQDAPRAAPQSGKLIRLV